jgi:hypothetical protein
MLLNVGHYGTVTPHHCHELGHSFADVIQGHYCAETGNDVSCCAAVCSKSGTPVMQVAYPRRKTTTDRQTWSRLQGVCSHTLEPEEHVRMDQVMSCVLYCTMY